MVALCCGGEVDFAVVDDGDASRADDASSMAVSTDAPATFGDSSAMADADDAGGRVQITFNYSAPSFIDLDCRPNALDPVGVDVDVVFDSPAGQGPQAVTFPAGRIKLSDGSRSLTWNFQVMTELVTPAPPPPLVVESVWNAPGSVSGVGSGVPCDYCGDTAEFDLEVSSPGQSAYWAGALSPVECMR
jgi:hypothetical protein